MLFSSWLRNWKGSLEHRAALKQILRRRPPANRVARRPFLETLEDRTLLSTFVVTNTGDNGGVNPAPGAGTGTLRQAIVDADAAATGTAANPDLIQFDIPATDPGYNSTTGAFTIQPLSALPTITDTLVLDGYTQPGASPNTLTTGDNAVLKIVLDASQAGAVNGLVIGSGNTTMRGLVIDNFASGEGIILNGSGNDVVVGNFIGTDVTGESAAANNIGITIESPSDRIGGTSPGDRNIISGNNSAMPDSAGGANSPIDAGIFAGSGGGNLIQGNYIGTDKSGTNALPNGTYGGIYVYPNISNNNTIGGTVSGSGNVISGNVGSGINLGSSQNLVAGNLIGTDVTGQYALGNGYGITITGNNNTIGGTTAGARNIVSGSNGNDGSGIIIDGEFGGAEYNTVEGNYIGTDITGTTGVGNDFSGIYVSGSFNSIGGTTAAARNIISGNSWNGITISGPGNFTDPNVSPLNPTGNTVEGNYIGTDATGTKVIASPRYGIFVQDGAYDNSIGGLTSTPGTGAGNVISGNAAVGIVLGNNGPDLTPLGTRNNTVEGNIIGMDATDSVVLGNGTGIGIGANDNIIGGTQADSANIISGNSLAGVEVQTGTGNTILGNSIYANGERGIQLDPQYTVSGGNDNQAAPVLTAATISGASTTISGTLASAANTTYRIEFFSNQVPSPSGEDGQTYLGYTQVITDGNGNASFTAPVPAGQAYLTATATVTDPNSSFNGDTSDFSHDTSLLSVEANSLAVSGSNGAVVSNTGTLFDGITGSSVTLTASVGTVVQNGNTWSWSETTPSGAAQTTPVTIYATDSYDQTVVAEFWLNVGQVFTVTNTFDDGSTGSLRWAVNQVNADTSDSAAQPDLIAFNIASAGMQTIYLDAALPSINNPVILDGMTEPGSKANSLPVQGATAGDNGVWTVTLDPSVLSLGGQDDTLTISGGHSTVQGLFITPGSENAIHLTTNGNDVVAGNYLSADLANGIFVDNVPSNTIGGTTPAARNIIGGGASAPYGVAGLWIDGAGATDNQVEGNYVGFDGTRPLFEPFGGGQYAFYDQTGILIQDASNNLVGGTANGAGNVIQDASRGIWLDGDSSGASASGNLVQGNYIGVNPAGTLPTIPEGSTGIFIQAYASNNIIGGTTSAARNIISGSFDGVFIVAVSPLIQQTGNVVEGNYIGTNAAGSAALISNEEDNWGIFVAGYGTNTMISSNLVSGWATGVDLRVRGMNVQVQDNYIGTDKSGTQSIPNGVGIEADPFSQYNQIGGTASGEGNLIAFNDGPGIEDFGTGDAIVGNSIHANIGPGVEAQGTGAQVKGNSIYSNTGPGVWVQSDPFGSADPNGAFSDGLSTDNSIQGNSIYGNGGLGITLGTNAVDVNGNPLTLQQVQANPALWDHDEPSNTAILNDSLGHVGANNYQNFPVLSSVSSSSTDTSISGTFSEAAEPNTTITLDFYANPAADPSGYGQGQTWIGSTTVTTDANSKVAFTADLATGRLGNLAGQWITATATDPNGNTSEFALDVQATAAPSQTYAQYLQTVLPQSSATANSMTIQASASVSPATVISALNDLTGIMQPVTVILDLGGGTYSTGGVSYNPIDLNTKANVQFVVQNGTLDPNYPALTVAGGQVVVSNCTLTTSGNAPALLVTGGSVTLNNDDISQTSTASTEPAIAVTGGTVNLGTAAAPGNNTLSVSNSSDLVSNTTGNTISAVGDTFEANGTVLTAPSLSFTALTSSSATTTFNQTVTFTATVNANGSSNTPTGSVDFFDTTTHTNLGSFTLSGGVATVSTSALGAGTHVIQATYSGDATFLSSIDTLSQVVNEAVPSFSLVAPPTVIDGTSNTQITGAIAAGSLIPSGSVTVTVNGVSKSAAINPANGNFAVTVPTASLGTGSYTIGYFYAGDTNFTSASATANMDVTNGVLALFNQSQSKHAGSTIPIQIELVSASGQDVSSSGTTVTALGIAATTDTTDTTGSIDPSLVGALQPVQAAGNSNPNNVFREQGGAKPYYMYNLQTPTGLTAGTYRLYFQVQGDPLLHWVTFSVS